MARSYSLSQRLTRALLIPIGLLWVVLAIGVTWYTQREVARIIDNSLAESAQRLLEIATHELSEHNVPLDQIISLSVSAADPSTPIIEDDNLMYQVVTANGRVLLRSADAPDLAMQVSLADGFSETAQWRVYTLKHNSMPVFIHIADPLTHRRTALLTGTAGMLLPLLAVLPLLAWLVRTISRRELEPVSALSAQIGERGGDDLRPVSDANMPRELGAIALSTNHLLSRLGKALDTERALASNAAHELRTPLATMRLRLQTVLDRTQDAGTREEIRTAVESLDQLRRRTEKLLQLSRAEAGAALAREPVELGHLAAAVAQDFWADPAVLARLRLELPDEDVMALGDYDSLAIALRNLVENAVRHAGGANIFISVEQPATVRVRDDGPGVSAENLHLLQHRHVRQSHESSGYGLGMSIVSTIVQRHEGEVQLASPPSGYPHGLEVVLVLRPAPIGATQASLGGAVAAGGSAAVPSAPASAIPA
jgi:two-component system, OmpR family, sensor kinase